MYTLIDTNVTVKIFIILKKTSFQIKAVLFIIYQKYLIAYKYLTAVFNMGNNKKCFLNIKLAY